MRRTSRNPKRRTTRHKGLSQLVKLAQSQGWLVERTQSGHIRFIPPSADRPMIVSSSTPSDHRSIKNLKARLKRSGLKMNRRPKRQAAGVTIVAAPTQRVLLLRRSKLVSKPGLWSIPAGRVEPGEDMLEGALRELREEAGYRGPLEIVEHIPSGHGFHNFIAVAPEEFKPRLNWESDMAGWFARGYEPQPLHPGLHRLFKRL